MTLLHSDCVEKAQKIQLVIFDVDGVLTDGRLYFTADGNEMKCFHVHDGLGLKQLLKNKIQVAIISGRNTPQVLKRMQELGVSFIYQGVDDKQPVYNDILKALNLRDEQVAYVGDDVPDIALIERAGFGISVSNAHESAKEIADWITTLPGGLGAAREVCDFILKAQGKLSP